MLNYNLINANSKDIDLLVKYALNNIFDHSKMLESSEIEKIKRYVNKHVEKLVSSYKIIVVDNKIVGCALVYDFEDGKLLSEIYIEQDYRSNGIGTDIISKILKKNNIVYLWVYKNNTDAIKLYKKLGFIIDKDTEERYLMKNITK